MLHPARRLWRTRSVLPDDGGCRLMTLERVLLNLCRAGDVDGFEIPGRFFHFLRTADPRPLEPVLEHNRLDLVSLAAVTSRALRLAAAGESGCRDGIEALALGRVLERGGALDRAEACYRRASAAACIHTRAEALYRLGLRCRREARFEDAAGWWRALLEATDVPPRQRDRALVSLRQFAIEALAIHHEHRVRDFRAARELALFALEEETVSPRATGMRHRLARLDRKLATKQNAQLFQ
jgi:tetratricopeptide (TPR) repeat protein